MDCIISEYLRDYVKATNRGTCRGCVKTVIWGRVKLASHKRAACTTATAAEKEYFRKAPTTSNAADSSLDTSMTSLDGSGAANTANNAEIPKLSDAKKEEIDSALATLCFRTGIPFRVIDSEAFRHFVGLLNPAYAEVMPKPRTVSGVLLEKEYNKSFAKLQHILVTSNNLALISDGWTNCRGDHIVNFLVKAPGRSSLFYKSINTTGIYQNADGITDAQCEVLQELGPDKFTSLVTDSAPVMTSAHTKMEERHSNISAFGCRKKTHPRTL